MTARELALRVACDVFPAAGTAAERGAQASFDYRARRAQLADRDRAFAAELAYGSIKMRRTLDWYLDPYVGRRRQTLPPTIAEILRLAVYEIVYTRADAYATVFEFVNLAKRCAHRGLANLVNAVLRSFLREPRKEPSRELFESEEAYLRDPLLSADVDRSAMARHLRRASRRDLQKGQRSGAERRPRRFAQDDAGRCGGAPGRRRSYDASIGFRSGGAAA